MAADAEGQRAVAPSLVCGGAVARSSAASRWDPPRHRRVRGEPKTRRPREGSPGPARSPRPTDRAQARPGGLRVTSRVGLLPSIDGPIAGGRSRGERVEPGDRARARALDHGRGCAGGRAVVASLRPDATRRGRGTPSGHSAATTRSGFLRFKQPVGCWDEQAQCVYRSATAAQELRREGVEPSCPGLIKSHLPPERDIANAPDDDLAWST